MEWMEIFRSYVAMNMHRIWQKWGETLHEGGFGTAGKEKIPVERMGFAAAVLHSGLPVPAEGGRTPAGCADNGTGRSRAGRDEGGAGSGTRRLRRRSKSPGQRPVGKGHQFGNRAGCGKGTGRAGRSGDPDPAGGRMPQRGKYRHQSPEAGGSAAAGEYCAGKSGGCVSEHPYERVPKPERKRPAGLLSAGRRRGTAAGRSAAEASDRRAGAKKGTLG